MRKIFGGLPYILCCDTPKKMPERGMTEENKNLYPHQSDSAGYHAAISHHNPFYMKRQKNNLRDFLQVFLLPCFILL